MNGTQVVDCNFGGGATGGGGTVNTGTQYAPAYYSGNNATISSASPFTGVGYYRTNGPPVAASAAQIAGVLGGLSGCTASGLALVSDGAGGIHCATVGASLPASLLAVATDSGGNAIASTGSAGAFTIRGLATATTLKVTGLTTVGNCLTVADTSGTVTSAT